MLRLTGAAAFCTVGVFENIEKIDVIGFGSPQT